MNLSLLTIIVAMTCTQNVFAKEDPSCDSALSKAEEYYDKATEGTKDSVKKFNTNVANIEKMPRVKFCKEIDSTIQEMSFIDNQADIAINRYQAYLERKCYGLKDSVTKSINELQQLKKSKGAGLEQLEKHKKNSCSEAAIAAATAKEAAAEKEKSQPKICIGLNNSIATIDKSAEKSGEAVKILYAIADSRLDKKKEMYPSDINQYQISKEELCKMVADAKKLNDESKESRQLASFEIYAAYRTLPGQSENKDLKKCDSKAKDEALELAKALDSVMDEWSPLIVTLNQSFCSDRKPAFVKSKDQVECLKESDTGPEKKAQSEAKIMLDVASKIKPKP